MIGIFLAGAFAISLGLFFNRNKLVNYALLFVFSALLVVFSIYEYNHINVIELEFFKPDAIGVLLLFALTIVSIPVIIHGERYIETHNIDETPKSRAVFFGAMVALISACSIVLISGHIAVTWIFIEITTLSASALIYHHRNLRALEGVWKYVFICAISITFVYIGILFISLSLKDAGIDDMSFDSLYANADKLNPFWLKLAFLFIFTGFTAKIGLVPMYTAGIDAKDKAPAPAGALISSVILNVGFIGIFRFYEIIAQTALHSWANNIIMISAVLSIFVATVYMTRIKNIKRMFAYSSIEHMGWLYLDYLQVE